MSFFKAAAAAGLLIGAAQASPYAVYGNGTHYTTEVVTATTTYCPGPTTLTYGDKTYTVTEATTLTVTDCSFTVTHPVKPTKPVLPPVVYTTEVLTAITTYCPEPTTLTHGNKTYTVTEPTTFTITDCPCTVTKPQSEHPYPVPTPGKPGKPEHPGKPGKPVVPGPHPTAPAPGHPGKPVEPEHPAPPATTGPVPVNPTGTYPVPEGTQPAVVTAAAGRIAPAGILAFIGAIALF
ncbi:hypothetical protein BKA59DRAFT_506483 [Fusarium tricinctum]|jgi:hypothetical protein|uniref:Cell wall protein SED1 n=2 Tax=Fusarium tricinctum species complex TaxID=679429 RepID=A0A8K0S9V9_9HYPO|nr:hypothetical protein BKA59DRAFT_506483 [Fusarium tricinctum]